MNKLRRMFAPTPEEEIEDNFVFEKMFNKLAEEKGCCTCNYCRHVIDYPGFVTGEESKCDVGLQCDTVYFSVRNCPKWERKVIE